MKLPKNLTIRRGGYYLRATIDGRAVLRSLRIPAKREHLAAAKKAAADLLYQLKMSPSTPTPAKPRRQDTLSDIIATYTRETAARGHPRPETAHRNVMCLKRIIITGYGHYSPNMAPDTLSDDLLIQYRDTVLAKNVAIDDQDRIRRSIRSTITQARSIFANGYRALYNLDHDLTPFLTLNPCDNPKKLYLMPPETLYRPILEAARNLPEPLRTVHLLVYDLALRASEAAAARPGWIETDKTGAYMVIRDRPEERFRIKGARPRRIPVSAPILAGLQGRGLYILPDTNNQRLNLIERDYAGWIKRLGWTRRQKAHEMRKLKGCFWYSRHDLKRTSAWLGHESHKTTLDHYVNLTIGDEPARLEGDDHEAYRKSH